MNHRFQWTAILLALFVFASLSFRAPAWSQTESDPPQLPTALVNGGMEATTATGIPTGWKLSPQGNGILIMQDTQDVVVGENALLVDTTAAESTAAGFVNLMQPLNASAFRGKRIRFRAAVHTSDLEGDARAQLWLRVDRKSNTDQSVIGAFDNMDDRPIRNDAWDHYDIVGQIDEDAERISVGLLAFGKGKFWLDDMSLEIIEDDTPAAGRRPSQSASAQRAPSQPFFVSWLWLVVIAGALFAVSQIPFADKSTAKSLSTDTGAFARFQRFALRFSVIYWLLYSLPEPFVSLAPFLGSALGPGFAEWCTPISNDTVHFVAKNFMGIEKDLVLPGGSGDTTFSYIRLLIAFVLAFGIAGLRSVFEWRKLDCHCTNDLLRSYLRYILAMTMLSYGLAKVGFVSNQFSEPGINQLLKSYGDSSPMNLVWTFMGASRPYTIFAGLGEVVGGLLLIWRRTTVLGAAVSFGVMLNVVMLNFCYDVPVKQYSAHLCCMAIFLMLPEFPRLSNLLLWNRPTTKVEYQPPYTTPSTIWVQRAVKAYVIVMLICIPLGTHLHKEFTHTVESLGTPEYFGDYQVVEFTNDGQVVPFNTAHGSRWHIVSMQRFAWTPDGSPGTSDMFTIRMMNKTRAGGFANLSDDETTISLKSKTPAVPKDFHVVVVDESTLMLSGDIEGRPVSAKLKRMHREDFLLVNRGFHWINEFPYNR